MWVTGLIISMHEEIGLNITIHACLYETAPTYVTKQSRFLNSAVRAVTKLRPRKLLELFKNFEQSMGRAIGIRYGPRPTAARLSFVQTPPCSCQNTPLY